MTVADRKLVDEAIQHNADDRWQTIISYLLDDLLEVLAEDDLDLKVVRKK